MFASSLFAGLFTRSTPTGWIILGVGIVCLGLYGVATGQCLVVTDLYGGKGRIVSALGMIAGAAIIWYGVSRL